MTQETDNKNTQAKEVMSNEQLSAAIKSINGTLEELKKVDPMPQEVKDALDRFEESAKVVEEIQESLKAVGDMELVEGADREPQTGDIVQFIPAVDDEQCRYNNAEILPAIITRVFGGTNISLKVMADGPGAHWRSSVPRDNEGKEHYSWRY